jgi:hypothetical protein
MAYPMKFPPVPTESDFPSSFCVITDNSIVPEEVFQINSGTAGTPYVPIMIVGVTNGLFPYQILSEPSNGFGQQSWPTSNGSSVQYVQSQSPNLINVSQIQLHTITITVSFYDNAITEKGTLYAGLLNEVLGEMGEFSGDNATALSEITTREFSLQKLLLLPSTRAYPISTLIGNPISIVGHGISPVSEGFMDPNIVEITIPPLLAKNIDRVDPHLVDPMIYRAHLKQKGKSLNKQSPPTPTDNLGAQPIPNTVGFNVVKDYMVPWVIFVPQEGSGATGQPYQRPPRISVQRSWVGVRQSQKLASDTFSAPGGPPSFPPATVLVNEVMERIPKKFRTMANQAMHDLVVVPAMQSNGSAEQLVQDICTVAQKGLSWATSQEGQKTLTLGAKILGAGLSAAVSLV